jgi:hypothetical protein
MVMMEKASGGIFQYEASIIAGCKNRKTKQGKEIYSTNLFNREAVTGGNILKICRMIPKPIRISITNRTWYIFYAFLTRFVKIPIPSISISTRSPGFKGPTPEGVPVAMMSPGSKVII